MKVIRILQIVSYLFICSAVNGQDYVPFSTDYAKWNESSNFIGIGFCGWSNDYHEMFGDTVILNTVYKKMYFHRGGGFFSEDVIYAGGLREDESKQIYFRPSLLSTNNFDNALLKL